MEFLALNELVKSLGLGALDFSRQLTEKEEGIAQEPTEWLVAVHTDSKTMICMHDDVLNAYKANPNDTAYFAKKEEREGVKWAKYTSITLCKRRDIVVTLGI